MIEKKLVKINVTSENPLASALPRVRQYRIQNTFEDKLKERNL